MIRRTILVALALLALPASAHAALEEPVTKPATGVTASEATLNGELNPKASATAGYHFTWNEAEFGCPGNETEGHEEQTGEGIPAEATLTGLIPHKKYAFCVVATHQEGETFESLPGPAETFETESLAPAIDAESASSTTPFATTLEAQVNPQNEPTTSCKLEWGTTTVSENELACEPEALEGFGDQLVSHRLEGLEPATTYKFRAVVANATGTTEGAESEVTTSALEAPIVDSESVSGITMNQARLEAEVNPNYQEATYVVEFAEDEAMTEGLTVVGPPEGTEPFPAGFEDHLATVLLKPELKKGSTYYYRVSATNATGTTQGPVQSFITIGKPLVEDNGDASQIGRTTARLEGGEVNAFGAETTWYYRYVDQAGYEKGQEEGDEFKYASSSLPLGHLAAAQGVQALPAVNLTELKPETTYYYAIYAENEVGHFVEGGESFTTGAATPPHATTGAASGVSQTAASVTGTVDPDGLETTWMLQLSSEPGAWTTVASGSLQESAEATELTFGLSFLAPGTTYTYRLLAFNADGEANGGEQGFATASFPPLPALAATPGPIPFTPLATLLAQEPNGTPHATKPLTRKHKPTKALQQCSKKHNKSKRKACHHQTTHKQH